MENLPVLKSTQQITKFLQAFLIVFEEVHETVCINFKRRDLFFFKLKEHLEKEGCDFLYGLKFDTNCQEDAYSSEMLDCTQ